MHPTYASAHAVIQESFGMLRDALSGLPDEASAWTPAPNTNSLSVLTEHCITSSRFWLGNAAGNRSSLTRYRADARAQSFATGGEPIAVLIDHLDAFLPELDVILAAGSEAALTAELSWPDAPDDRLRSGAEALFHSVGHLREHVGQAQLMRDLWLAR